MAERVVLVPLAKHLRAIWALQATAFDLVIACWFATHLLKFNLVHVAKVSPAERVFVHGTSPFGSRTLITITVLRAPKQRFAPRKLGAIWSGIAAFPLEVFVGLVKGFPPVRSVVLFTADGFRVVALEVLVLHGEITTLDAAGRLDLLVGLERRRVHVRFKVFVVW